MMCVRENIAYSESERTIEFYNVNHKYIPFVKLIQCSITRI